MRAVWLVRGRELAGRLRFWTAIVGYDPRNRSVGQSIYLVYVVIFFSIWGLAVLAFLADLGAGLLLMVGSGSPESTAVRLITLAMLAGFFIQGYNASRRSPYLFSDADSELICQAPLDRGLVALAWFLGDWLPGGILITSAAVVLRFALLQLPGSNPVVWQNLPYYIFTGMLAALVVLPIHLMLTALVYSLGSVRLVKDRELPWLPWGVILFALGLALLALVGNNAIQYALWLLTFPLQAAFGQYSWILGFSVAIILASAGSLCLYLVSRDLNLSRAAQESRYRFSLQQAGRSGDTRLSQSIRTRQRLGIAHPASRLPGRPGASSLIWKNWVSASRTINLTSLAGWAAIFGLGLGLFLVADWGSRVWIFVVYCLLVGGRCTARLRSDLEVWSLTRQLPFSASEFLFNAMILPVLAAITLTWLAIMVASLLGGRQLILGFVLAPVAIVLISLTAAFDIFRHCRASQLLLGQVADPGILGLLLGIVSTSIPLVFVYWMMAHVQLTGMGWLAGVTGWFIEAGMFFLIGKVAVSTYQHIS
jgi:hypothetical protein